MENSFIVLLLVSDALPVCPSWAFWVVVSRKTPRARRNGQTRWSRRTRRTREIQKMWPKPRFVFFMTGPHSEAVPKLVVVDLWHSEGILERIQGAVANHALTPAALSDRGLFHATLSAVLLTVRGRGIPGVRARVTVFPNKPDRWVLHEIQVVEERLVPANGAKSEAVILECKSACLYVTFYVTRSSFLVCCILWRQRGRKRYGLGRKGCHVSDGLAFSLAPAKFSRTFLFCLSSLPLIVFHTYFQSLQHAFACR